MRAAAGAKVRASGFGRVKMNVPAALERIARREPRALMFGAELEGCQAASSQCARRVIASPVTR